MRAFLAASSKGPSIACLIWDSKAFKISLTISPWNLIWVISILQLTFSAVDVIFPAFISNFTELDTLVDPPTLMSTVPWPLGSWGQWSNS